MTRGLAPARDDPPEAAVLGGSGASSDTVGSRSAFGMTSGKGERLAPTLSTPPPSTEVLEGEQIGALTWSFRSAYRRFVRHGPKGAPGGSADGSRQVPPSRSLRGCGWLRPT